MIRYPLFHTSVSASHTACWTAIIHTVNYSHSIYCISFRIRILRKAAGTHILYYTTTLEAFCFYRSHRNPQPCRLNSYQPLAVVTSLLYTLDWQWFWAAFGTARYILVFDEFDNLLPPNCLCLIYFVLDRHVT